MRVQIFNKHLGMAKLKFSLFWVWFWVCFYFATQSDFKEWERIFHQNYHAGFGGGQWGGEAFKRLLNNLLALCKPYLSKAAERFEFHFREENTIPKKEERLTLHLKATVSNSRQRNLDGKGNKRSGLYHRFAFIHVSHLIYMIGHWSWRSHGPLF